jgi:glutathione S-transferase
MKDSARFLFYGTEVSYFSGKVRPALRYKRIPFEEIPPTPTVYREVIVPRTGLAFIPILITPQDEVLQDTSDILDELERRFPSPPLYPDTALQRMLCSLVELYADEFLVLPAMHYRWGFRESEEKIRRDFSASIGDAETGNRFADRMKGTLPAIGVVPDTAPAIEAHTRELLDILSRHFETYPFLLGDGMSLADCALMGPLYAHLYLDAVPGRLLRETAPAVCRVPETLRPLVELIGRDAIPVVIDTVRAFEIWADERPAGTEEPPRTVGTHTTHLRGQAVERVTSSYTLWMLQRPLEVHQKLPAGERTCVESWLKGTGIEAGLAYAPHHRLGKRHFKLIFSS